MTKDYLTELKSFGVICGGGEEERLYRVEVPHRGERRLLQRCFVAPSQFHPNAWSAIRCFELVTKFLELPQDPEVFLFLFTVFSPNADGKAKKGYMSVRPGKGRRIFGLYEESFHDFKGQYFKVFPVGDHQPFWLTLEGDASRFPSYWSKDAGVNYVPVSYRKLNDEQRDTTDILLWLFSKQNLRPKAILGNPERGRVSIVKMADRNKTLANLRRYMVANPQGPIVLSPFGGQASSSKRLRTSEGPLRDLCPMDRSFDASGYIERNFMGPRACEALRDYDPIESLRWAEWAMLCSATIMKSVEPRLTVANQWEQQCAKLRGDLKALSRQKTDLEKEKEEAEAAKSKVDKDLESSLADLKEKGVELQRLRDREASLLADLRSAQEKLLVEKSRANQAEASLAAMEQARPELVKLAEDSVKATEDILKEQILLLAPDFDVSLIGAWKEVVDGQIVDQPLPEGQIINPPPQE
ncbi:hypothetical protein PIB30_010707 [Stylosanthes scabra]|uniref:Uncharacterized protein n=1 Tax=Stylosanthes scabra TaxID=79078 RepID=A0ABU6X3S6_9FABA|nr:hypothetical protein [Stylosanthes scabra]